MNTSTASNKDVILQQVAAVPLGQISSYGAIAKAAGLPGYARYVGAVLKGLPKDTKLPWHRILNAQKRISFPPSSQAFKEQKKRLEEEGLTIINDRVV